MKASSTCHPWDGPRKQSQAPSTPLAFSAPNRYLALVAAPILWAGCLAASPVTASLKDLNVPAMVGPQRSGQPATATPIDERIRNSYLDSPMVMRPGTAAVDDPRTLAWNVLKAVPQCTQCTVAISNVPVGSYTTALPTDFFFWYSKNWSGIEGSAYERGPVTSTGGAASGKEGR
jgi:hypothetical protein